MVGTANVLWVATRARELLRLHPGAADGSRAVPLAMQPSAIAVRGDDVWIGQELDNGQAQIVRIDARTGVIDAWCRAAGIEGMVYAHGRVWTIHGEPNRLTRGTRHAASDQRHTPRIDDRGARLRRGALWVTVPDQNQLVRYQPGTEQPRDGIGRRPPDRRHRPREARVGGGERVEHRRADRGAEHAPVGDPIRVPLNPLAIAATDDAIWVTCVGDNVVARVAAPS